MPRGNDSFNVYSNSDSFPPPPTLEQLWAVLSLGGCGRC